MRSPPRCLKGLLLVASLVPGSWAIGPLHRRLQQADSGASAPVEVGPPVSFFQSLLKDGHMDPLDAINMALESPGYKALLGNAEIHRRILEEIPLLRAFPAFKDLHGRRLSDEETVAGFSTGMKQATDFVKSAATTVQDPMATVDVIRKLATSSDPHTQDVFTRAKAGERDAVEELQRLYVKDQYPGLDLDVLKEVAASHSFDKLLGMDEIMRFIDRDQAASDVFRNPMSFTG